MKFSVKARAYYSLTKPGVLYGNALTAVAGFLFASRNGINVWLFLALLFGSTLVIASACVINNFLDQDIDKKMERTKKRASVTGAVGGTQTVIFSIVLGILGIGILALFTNSLVVILGIIGFIDYVVLYGMLSKRLSYHGTLVGAISGAVPILSGYVAVSGMIDASAIVLFAILFLWQMPEFYSIAVYRKEEYAKAGVPVISVVKGKSATIRQIFVYTLLFVVSLALLTIVGIAGYTYLTIMMVLGAYWIYLGMKGLSTKEPDAWSKKMFRFSLIILLVFCFMISVDPLLV